MKQSLKITAATSSSSAEQPTSPGADQHGDGASAGQPALQLGSTSAVQPALQLGTSSAAQPATLLAIPDVQAWLTSAQVAGCTGADVERIRTAVNILTRPKPRQEDVRPLQGKWQVAQKTKDKTARPLKDVIE